MTNNMSTLQLSNEALASSKKVTPTIVTKVIDSDDPDGVPIILAEVDLNDSKAEGQRTLVADSETVPPEVKWQPDHRQYHDKICGVLFLLAWTAFLACGFMLVGHAHPRYEWVSAGNGDNTTVRVISSHFRDDVATCCGNKPAPDGYSFDLCGELSADAALRRRLSPPMRALDDNDGYQYNFDDDTFTFEDDRVASSYASKPRTSKYEHGDGMFDAFLEAPEIIITMSLFAMALALIWIVLLQFFATPIVYATEIIKVAFFVYLSIQSMIWGAIAHAVIALLCAAAVVAWDVYTFQKLQFAGHVLSQASVALQKNAVSLVCGILPIIALYALNGVLFVLFFARSFENVEVKSNEYCRTLTSGAEKCHVTCDYEAPSYTVSIAMYLGFAYLWSILLLQMMRLSIISTVIGSWHFYPDDNDKPGVLRAVINTCTTSMGTLCVASLIATVAEKLNRMLMKETMWQQCWNPVFWALWPLYCVFGACLQMIIRMATKFSVILHVFTGMPWRGSAKKVFKILKRHFKGGFVTEYASTSVLALGAYVFSIAIYFITWVWLDREFKTETFFGVNKDSLMVVGWLFFALFNIWYPVLGLYVIILANRWLSKWDSWDPAEWVTPLAATFVACLAMMFFTYLAGIFLDTVDVLFLCFAIDRDNNVDMSDDEFAKLVADGVPNMLETPDLEGVEQPKDDDEEKPEQPIMVTDVEPMAAPISK